MKYEKPNMDILKLENYDVVTLSGGTGDVDGDIDLANF